MYEWLGHIVSYKDGRVFVKQGIYQPYLILFAQKCENCYYNLQDKLFTISEGLYILDLRKMAFSLPFARFRKMGGCDF